MKTIASFPFIVPLFGKSLEPTNGCVDVIIYGSKDAGSFTVERCRFAYYRDPSYIGCSDSPLPGGCVETYPYACNLSFSGGWTLSWQDLDKRGIGMSYHVDKVPLAEDGEDGVYWLPKSFPYGTQINCAFFTIDDLQIVYGESANRIVQR
ncbi:MAG: hypothetical protein ACOX18_01010 [Bacillota bacterium]|jgi:hypothetical protein